MGIIVFLGLSFVVIVHELGHFLMSKLFGVAVEEFGIGFPPRIWSKKIKETVYSFNWILWGGFLKINGLRSEVERKDLPPHTSFMRQSFYKKALIIAGGVMINFFLGWFLLFIVMTLGIPQGIFVADIKPESLAYYSGFQKGDLILNFQNADEFNAYLKESAGKEADFKVKRDGFEKNISVLFPKESSKTGEILGIYYSETGTPKVGILKGVVESFKTACNLVASYLSSYISLIGRLFTDSSALQNLMGPVGLFAIGSLISKAGLIYFIQLLAYLSINFVIFNFLPFPMLDGGWFMVVLIEKIKGSPVGQKTEMIVNGFGFIVLFSLFLFTTIKDVIGLF